MGERFVVHSPTRGVFLGDQKWTKDTPIVVYNEVPTFTADQLRDQKTYQHLFTVPDAVIYQVPPDRRGEWASRSKVNNCFVPEDW